MNEFTNVNMNMVLCGSEKDISRDFAIKFVDQIYYVECDQPYTTYVENLRKKFIDCILAVKNFPHDLICQSGSDDFVDIDFFREVIKLYISGKDYAIFCNGIYDDKIKRGGIRYVAYDKKLGQIMPFIHNDPERRPSFSNSMGPYIFTKKAMISMGYTTGCNEKIIEKRAYDLKIPKFIIPQKYYSIKNTFEKNVFSSTIHPELRLFSDSENKEYLEFITKIESNLPPDLKYLINK